MSLEYILLTQLKRMNGDISKENEWRYFQNPARFLPHGTHIIILPETQPIPNSSFTLNPLPGQHLRRVSLSLLTNWIMSVYWEGFLLSQKILYSKKYNAFLLILNSKCMYCSQNMPKQFKNDTMENHQPSHFQLLKIEFKYSFRNFPKNNLYLFLTVTDFDSARRISVWKFPEWTAGHAKLSHHSWEVAGVKKNVAEFISHQLYIHKSIEE